MDHHSGEFFGSAANSASLSEAIFEVVSIAAACVRLVIPGDRFEIGLEYSGYKPSQASNRAEGVTPQPLPNPQHPPSVIAIEVNKNHLLMVGRPCESGHVSRVRSLELILP